MKFCTNCGNPVQENQKFCPNCGCVLEQPAVNKENEIPYEKPAEPVSAGSAASAPQPKPAAPKKKHAAISIIAFILSLTLFLSPIGVILAVIDLIVNKGRKHGLSIAALIIGGILSILLIAGILSPSSSSSSSSDTSPSVSDKQEAVSPTEDPKDAFISSCKTVSYQDVERSPDSYKGQNIRIEGTVIQVSEGWLDSVVYRVATDSRGHDDIWYVTYTRSSEEERILEDDHVVIYGTCSGVETYKTVLGSSVTIPALKAKYIETADSSEPEYTAEIVKFNIAKEKYGDNYEYYAIVAIQNTDNRSLYISDASFDLEDATGHLLQTDDFEASIFRSIIKPGETGYIYTSYAVDIKDPSNLESIVLQPHFTVQVTYVTLNEYEVSDVSVSNGSYGDVTLTGRVTNNTDQDESYLYLRVAYFDSTGNVLGIAGTSVTDLSSGKTASFEVSGYSMNTDFTAEDVAYFEVLAVEDYYGF